MPGNLQRGLQRSGVSGTTINIANQTAVFHGDTLRWTLRDSRSVKARRGRGLSNRYSQYRYLYADGGGVLLVKRIEGDWPGPANIEHTGSITYTIHNSRTIVVPIRITEFAPSEDPTKQDDVVAQVSYVTTGPPVFSGWSGTQPTSTAPTASDMQLWEGTVFAKDPQGLTSNSQITVDWWDTAVGDSNAAEVAKLDAKINTFLAPFTGMKLRTASFTRDSTDGGTIVFACGLTDTRDDVLNPINKTRVDDLHLESDASTAEINGTPPRPTGDAFIFQTLTSTKLNDAKTLFEASWGLLTTREKIEFPGTTATIDVSDLSSVGQQTIVNPPGQTLTPTVPPGLQIVDSKVVRINQQESAYVWDFGKDTSKQKVEQDNSFTLNDALNIASRAQIARLDNPNPQLPAGFVDRGVTVKQITHDHALYTREGGLRSTIADITYPGTGNGDDPNHLEDVAKITVTTPTSATPAVPNAPLGEFVKHEWEQVNDLTHRHTFHYANTDSAHQKTFEDAAIDDDSSDLGDEDTQKVLADNSTAPTTPTPRIADLQLVRRYAVRLTSVPQKWLHVFKFGRNTNQDKIELDGTRTNQDPDDFGETAEITRVTTSVNPPATPAAPVGQLIETETHPITQASGSYTGRWKHTFKYGPTTKKQEIEFSGETAADPRFLNDTDAVPIVSLSSAPPAVPTPSVPGLKFRRRRSTRVQGTPEKWKHVFEFARTDSVDDVVNPQTFTDTDVSGLKSSARRLAVFQPDGTGPTAPTVPGFVRLNSGNVKPLNDAWSVIIWDYGLSTTQQEQEFAESEASDDPRLLDQQAEVASSPARRSRPRPRRRLPG
jgi:hypothetical protein